MFLTSPVCTRPEKLTKHEVADVANTAYKTRSFLASTENTTQKRWFFLGSKHKHILTGWIRTA